MLRYYQSNVLPKGGLPLSLFKESKNCPKILVGVALESFRNVMPVQSQQLIKDNDFQTKWVNKVASSMQCCKAAHMLQYVPSVKAA